MVLNAKETLTLSLSDIPPVVADFLGIPEKSKSMHVPCRCLKGGGGIQRWAFTFMAHSPS